MKKLLIALNLVAALAVSTAAQAQQSLLPDPEVYEKDYFKKQCAEVSFSDGFATRQDINNDGLVDVVVNEGKMTCDGSSSTKCDEDGCVNNFYLQVAEGGYFMIATAKTYGYDIQQRYGNKVLAMKMHPRFCDRPNADPKTDPCVITTRVRGTKFVTIFKK
ncbi:hypothetical protein [Rhizobium metallidurans]|uniref:Uncharacterized protein n=1 Tax=Rhizobium metallidurans TaxID=1265931 RepID=A0A7W6CZ65_9HYPH|nr:hypothetical protein [Rhizobium metallidurans]